MVSRTGSIFFSGWDQLPPPQEGDLLLTRVDYLGSAALADNTVGSVYTMEAMQFRAGSWVPQEAPFTLVLSRSAGDGVFLSVAGEAISNPAAMSLDEVARQPFRDRSLTCYFWAHKSPRRMLCCRQMEDRHTNIGGPPCPTMNGLSFYRKIPIFARGQGIFVSFHKEREKK